MCIFCENGSKVWCGRQKMKVLRSEDAKTGAPAFILTQGFDDDAQTVTLQVKYCPWCGERLGGEIYPRVDEARDRVGDGDDDGHTADRG